MDVSKNNENLSIIVGRNVSDLRNQAGLTIEGITFAFSISISYTLMIERGAANISSKLAKNIATFFGIEVAQLYSAKRITLKSPTSIVTISKFYEENQVNAKFFIYRRTEYSVASFVRNVLLIDTFITKKHTVGELRVHSKDNHRRELDSQELSREVRRLYLKGILKREAKFENGSVYLYWLE